MTYIAVFEWKEVGLYRKKLYSYDFGLYRLILPKMSTSGIEHKIWFLGVLNYQKVSSDYKIMIRVTIEGLDVDLAKNVNVFPWTWNCVVDGF